MLSLLIDFEYICIFIYYTMMKPYRSWVFLGLKMKRNPFFRNKTVNVNIFFFVFSVFASGFLSMPVSILNKFTLCDTEVYLYPKSYSFLIIAQVIWLLWFHLLASRHDWIFSSQGSGDPVKKARSTERLVVHSSNAQEPLRKCLCSFRLVEARADYGGINHKATIKAYELWNDL